MPKFKHHYGRRQDFKDWCTHWFELGKYVRKEDWKPALSSISSIREFNSGDSGNHKTEKYIYPDAKYTCECVDGDIAIITNKNILTGKWIIDDPMENIFVKR